MLGTHQDCLSPHPRLAGTVVIHAALVGLTILVLTQLLAWAILLHGEAYAGKMSLVVLCATLIVVGLLATPLLTQALPTGSAGVVAWPILIGAIVYPTMLLYEPRILGSELVLRLAVAVAVLSFALERAAAFLCNLGCAPLAAPIVVIAVSMAAAAPVWLGPWVGLVPTNQGVINTVIAVSPLSYLATMADYDILRSSWFYRHTPFGGLRYAYPDRFGLSFAYFAVGSLIWAGMAALHRKPAQLGKGIYNEDAD